MNSSMDHTLRYLLLIRLVVIGGQIVALAAMDLLFGVVVPWLKVSLVLALLAVFTARSWQRLGRAGPATNQRHYLVQSLADIVALSALIIVAEWRQRRPEVQVRLVCDGPTPAPGR